MSNFFCEFCGTELVDSPRGYVTGCPHYPSEVVRRRNFAKWNVFMAVVHQRRIDDGAKLGLEPWKSLKDQQSVADRDN